MSRKAPRVRRDLEFVPLRHQGRRMVLIQDGLGLVREGTAVPAELFQVLALLDGTRGVTELACELTRMQGGILAQEVDVRRMVEDLDEARLLDSPAYRQARDKVRSEFAAHPVRPCTLAGLSYPDEPGELAAWLDQAMANADTSASPPDPGASDAAPGRVNGRLTALVAPHIDPRVGAGVYGRAYAAARGATPDRVIVLGVGHSLVDGLICITEKHFETPLGTVVNDVDLTRALAAAGRGLSSPDDFAHRREHSIEFQVVYLQRVLAGHEPRIVPMLWGSLLGGLPEYSRQAFVDVAGPLVAVLRAALSDPTCKTLLVAGVDLSHVGPKFGHECTAQALELEATTHDRELLDLLAALDADGFWEESVRVQDRYNVCGFAPLACLLEVLAGMRGVHGQVLGYQFQHEPATQSAVGFGAMKFSR